MTGLGFAVLSSSSDYLKVYTLYLDAAGNVFGSKADGASSGSSVVYVINQPYMKAGAYGAITMNYQCVDSTGAEVIYSTGAAVDPTVSASGFYKVTVINGVADFTAYTPSDLAVPTVDGVIATGDNINGTNFYYKSDVMFIFVSGSGTTLKIEKIAGLAAANGNTLAGAALFIDSSNSVNKMIHTVIIPAAYVNPSTAGQNLVYIPNLAAYSGMNASGYVYSVYIDGVKTDINATNVSLAAYDNGFATYTISNGIYTFTGVNAAANLTYNVSVPKDGIFNGYINGHVASGAVVVDLVTDPQTGTLITTLSGMEAITATNAFIVDYVTNTAGVITFVYIKHIV
jgi:hypothetical protein